MTPEGGQYDFCAMTLNQEEVKKKKKKRKSRSYNDRVALVGLRVCLLSNVNGKARRPCDSAGPWRR